MNFFLKAPGEGLKCLRKLFLLISTSIYTPNQ